jgi:hypothetical protein
MVGSVSGDEPLGLFALQPRLTKDEMFEQWISEYPKAYCVARGSARREFMKRTISMQRFAHMMEMLAIQKASARWAAGYVPSPKNYLADERDVDPIEAYPPAQTFAVREACTHTPQCHNAMWCQVVEARLRGKA